MDQERRGLRFSFSASAEAAPESAPTDFAPARVTELSLRGCFLETSASFEMQAPCLAEDLQFRGIFRGQRISPLCQAIGHGSRLSRNKASLSRRFATVGSPGVGQPT